MAGQSKWNWCVVDQDTNQRLNPQTYFSSEGAAEHAAMLNKPIGRFRYIAAPARDYPL